MYVYHNIETDQMMSVSDTYLRQAIIQRMKKRFQTYGYDEILTSVFEQYDLYAKMNGTVNHKQMIKTIDNTGEVLVLRPDVTIPLTQQLAKHNKEITEHIRYFYVLDVFRQEQETNKYRES
ncbi:MAG TPA: ATP phosphoribosyltransferase regulatory subunit, partial [Pseudogracilibacillus sp.]|nr:ATP phosphoribosyltransferase regulatory subunit [Pseudogracilibacillus sp.]